MMQRAYPVQFLLLLENHNVEDVEEVGGNDYSE
jgi:hypothetical protein